MSNLYKTKGTASAATTPQWEETPIKTRSSTPIIYHFGDHGFEQKGDSFYNPIIITSPSANGLRVAVIGHEVSDQCSMAIIAQSKPSIDLNVNKNDENANEEQKEEKKEEKEDGDSVMNDDGT